MDISRVLLQSRCSVLTALKCKTESCRSSSRSYTPTWQTDAASHDAISPATRGAHCAGARTHTVHARWM